MKIKFSDLLGVCLILASATLCLNLNAAGLVGASANDVTSSEYNSKDLSLVAQVHTARLFTDYERQGFFRIGLLPIPVAEDVQIQIRSADCLTNALLGLHFWNQPSVGVRRLELRNLEIKLFGEKQPRLSAVTARLGQDGVFELSTVSLFNASGQPMLIPKATLQATGSFAGWLHWNFDGHPQDIFVFKLKSEKTP